LTSRYTPCQVSGVAFTTIDGLLLSLDFNDAVAPPEQYQPPSLVAWDLENGLEVCRIPLLSANVFNLTADGVEQRMTPDLTWSTGLQVTMLSVSTDGTVLAAMTEVCVSER
jgi:hypothetical protein